LQSDRERGEKRASFETVIALAAALEVAPIVLFQSTARKPTQPCCASASAESSRPAPNTACLQQVCRVVQAVAKP
jgi:hypothetical protein